jgi:hypothetical protein
MNPHVFERNLRAFQIVDATRSSSPEQDTSLAI